MGLILHLLVHLLPLLPYRRRAMRLRCLFSFRILFFKMFCSATDFQKIRANLYIVLLLSLGGTRTNLSCPAPWTFIACACEVGFYAATWVCNCPINCDADSRERSSKREASKRASISPMSAF